MDSFKSTREFENSYPHKLYLCPNCGIMTENPYQCTNCSNQSTNFIYKEKSYTYHIQDINKTETIFTPIERIKNENTNF